MYVPMTSYIVMQANTCTDDIIVMQANTCTDDIITREELGRRKTKEKGGGELGRRGRRRRDVGGVCSL